MERNDLSKRSIGSNLETSAMAEMILPLLATMAVVMRLYLRKKCRIAFGWDDYIIALSLPFNLTTYAMWLHICTAVLPGALSTVRSMDILRQFLLEQFIMGVFIYVIGVLLVKISIILFYFRAFGVTRKRRVILWILLALNIAWTFFRFLGALLDCLPIDTYWNDPQSCNLNRPYFISVEAIGVVMELAILIFPIPSIWGLKQPLKKKLGILAVLSLGLAAVAASAVRVYIVEQVGSGKPTIDKDDAYPLLILTMLLELNASTVSVCLAASHRPMVTVMKKWVMRWKGSQDQDGVSHGIVEVETPQKRDLESALTTTIATTTIDSTEQETDESIEGRNSVAVEVCELKTIKSK